MSFKIKFLLSCLSWLLAPIAALQVAVAEEMPAVRIANDIPSIDWHKTRDLVSAKVILNLMVGLTALDEKDQPAPALAQSWKISDFGKTYVFELKKDLVWSDKAPVVAQHFVDGFLRLLDPKTAAPGAELLWVIKGAKEYSLGKQPDKNLVGVKALDSRHIEIDLERPANSLLSLLSFTISMPVRIDLINKFGDKWLAPENLAVVGPYKLASSKSQQIVLEANEHYYGPAPVIKKFKFLVVSEAATAVDLFDTGALDVIFDPPRSKLESIRNLPEFKVYSQVRAFGIGFNTQKAPFDNVKVRQALALATDRKSIVDVLDIHRKPNDPAAFDVLKSWIPKGIDCYNSKIGLEFNEKMARKKLAEAGYPDGKNFPKVKLTLSSSEANKIMAERLQDVWGRVLNIKVEIEVMEFAVFLNRLTTDTPDLFSFGIGSIFNDPYFFSAIFIGDAPINHSHWKNADYDKLVLEGSETEALKERQKKYDAAERILLEREVIFIPVFQSPLTALVSKRLKGFTFTGQGTPMMSWANYSPNAKKKW